MKCIIISGGNAPSRCLLQSEMEEASIIICADSGADCLLKYNITPHYIVGDLDSIKQETLTFFEKDNNVIFEKYLPEKDYTDTDIALDKAISLECDKVVFLGCTGTRLDHFLGNLGMLKKCLLQNIKSSIKDDNNTILITNDNIIIKGEKGSYFSLQPYCSVVNCLSIEGSKYELYNYNLFLGDSLTISNEFKDNNVKISFSSGILLVMICKD